MVLILGCDMTTRMSISSLVEQTQALALVW